MTRIWLWIVGAALIWPLQLELGALGEKGVDAVASDALPVLIPFILIAAARRRTVLPKPGTTRWKPALLTIASLPAALFIIYCLTIACVGYGMSSEVVRLLSSIKLVKSIGYVFLGMALGSRTDPLEQIDIIGTLFGAVVALTLFSTITDPVFPGGRWGRTIFGWELYGFPNSPMSFYGVLTPLLLAAADTAKSPFKRTACWGLAACNLFIILGSISRSSLLAFTVATVAYLLVTGRGPILSVIGMGLGVLSAIGVGLFAALKDTHVMQILVDRVGGRFAKTTNDEDPSSGRFDIWEHAIDLWTEKPVFGYMFESFSHYSEYDTPHQQYLEVIYKTGGLGFVLYVWLLAACYISTRHLCSLTKKENPAWRRMTALQCMLIGTLVGNLTQPNLSYSPTGNTIFLLFGCLFTHSAVSVITQEAMAGSKPVDQQPAQPRGRPLPYTRRTPPNRSAA